MAKQRVLIVDDEAAVRRVLGDALSRSGLQVELVSSGNAALDRLSQPGIDLLLLDLQLSDINGLDVMQSARERWPDLPIIMLTGHGSLPSAIAAVRAGVADYLLKPINIATLRDAVHRVLAEYSDAREREQRLRAVYEQIDALLRSEGLFQPVAVGKPISNNTIYESAPLRIDVQQHTASLHGRPIGVTPSEFLILLELLRVPGAVMTCLALAQMINSEVEDEEDARQLIRPHIARLRRKLERNAQDPIHLISVRGLGYRWVGASESTDTKG
jgi:DNA-binding response OmpR family regulator